MSGTLKLFLTFLGLVLVIFLGLAAYFHANPVGAGIALARRGLGTLGLSRERLYVRGHELVYWRGGARGGETVVLLHGLGQQAGSWVKVAGALAGGSRLVIPDLPGHGDSGPERGELPLDDMVHALTYLVEHEAGDERPVVLVGHDLGGWVAARYALEHPHRVRRLVLLSPWGLAPEPDEPFLRLPRDREEALRYVQAINPPEAPRPVDFVLDDLVEKIEEGPTARLLAALTPADYLNRDLPRLAPPVDLVWGEADGLLPLSYARRFQALLPGARLHLLPACGHIPHQQCPEQLRPLLERLARE